MRAQVFTDYEEARGGLWGLGTDYGGRFAHKFGDIDTRAV